eukprot:scaffold172_cov254-Pinguiococcus_pyrenoidosus.AAC.28
MDACRPVELELRPATAEVLPIRSHLDRRHEGRICSGCLAGDAQRRDESCAGDAKIPEAAS